MVFKGFFLRLPEYILHSLGIEKWIQFSTFSPTWTYLILPSLLSLLLPEPTLSYPLYFPRMVTYPHLSLLSPRSLCDGLSCINSSCTMSWTIWCFRSGSPALDCDRSVLPHLRCYTLSVQLIVKRKVYFSKACRIRI